MAYTAPSTQAAGYVVTNTDWNELINNWLTLHTAAGLLTHEYGGLEADISAIVQGDLVHGTGTGTAGLLTKGSAGDYLRINSAGTDVAWSPSPQYYSYKSADETVNNSAALQADDHLQFVVAANGVYRWEMLLDIESGLTPDFQWSFFNKSGTPLTGSTAPAIGTNTLVGNPDHLTGVIDPASAAINVPCDGTRRRYWALGTFITGVNAGTVGVQWAQGTADLSDTKVYTGSWLMAHRLDA